MRSSLPDNPIAPACRPPVRRDAIAPQPAGAGVPVGPPAGRIAVDADVRPRAGLAVQDLGPGLAQVAGAQAPARRARHGAPPSLGRLWQWGPTGGSPWPSQRSTRRRVYQTPLAS